MRLLPPEKDLVVLRLSNGLEYKVPWCTSITGYPIEVALLPRMPVTPEEQVWLWRTLPTYLVPGGSVRLMGPSLHD